MVLGSPGLKDGALTALGLVFLTWEMMRLDSEVSSSYYSRLRSTSLRGSYRKLACYITVLQRCGEKCTEREVRGSCFSSSSATCQLCHIGSGSFSVVGKICPSPCPQLNVQVLFFGIHDTIYGKGNLQMELSLQILN